MSTYTIGALLQATCPESDLTLLSTVANITFSVQRGYRSTWDEPGQADTVEFVSVSLGNLPSSILPERAEAWARWWLDENQSLALQCADETNADHRAQAAELRAGVRADQVRIFGEAA